MGARHQPVAGAATAADRHPGPGTGRGPPARPVSPRPQAVQRLHGSLRHADLARLRPGAAAAGRVAGTGPDHRRAPHHGHAAVHGTRASVASLGAIGPHTDQYSLGIILFELLTGQRPFTGDPAEMVVALASQPVP